MSSNLTIVTPAASQNLTVLATVKQEFGITDGSEDAKLARWITEASNIIATKCNRVFGKEQISEQFRLKSAQSELILRRRPVISIVSVTEDDVVLDVADYEIDKTTALLTRVSSGAVTDWAASWATTVVTVVYFGGYELLDGLPYDLERACIKLVGHYRSTLSRDPFVKGEQIDIPGVRSKRTDYWVGSITGGDDLPPEVSGLIEQFREHSLG